MEPFRDSQFIDFNRGIVKVPPMALIEGQGPRHQQAIELMLMTFACRVDVWQLGPAVELLKLIELADRRESIWAHGGYALLGAVFSYFEMVGKILNPASSVRRTAGVDFNFGFCDVYPTFARGQAERSDTAVPDVAQFRNRVRNGIYHLGYTKSHLFIHNAPQEFPHDFTIDVRNGNRLYFVNPHSMTRTVVAHFPTLMQRLWDWTPAFDELRSQFVKFYVAFHDGGA